LDDQRPLGCPGSQVKSLDPVRLWQVAWKPLRVIFAECRSCSLTNSVTHGQQLSNFHARRSTIQIWLIWSEFWSRQWFNSLSYIVSKCCL